MQPSSVSRQTVDLAVIIVSWNVQALVLDALRSLYADLETSRLRARVLLVDSASSDGTAETVQAAFPQTEVFAERKNVGFVRGNNRALRVLGLDEPTSQPGDPRAVYLLNPDTITQPGATRALFDALFAEPRVGLVGANLSYGDGGFQDGAFAFPGLRQLWAELFPTPGRLRVGMFNGRYSRARYELGRPFDVDFVLGAAMMARSEAVRDVGLLDEGFEMYCEEIDWAWRMRRAGWDARCVPAAKVVHLGGQSSGQARPQSLIRLWTSRLRLYDLYYTPIKRRIARWMVRAGMQRLARRVDSPEVRAAYEQIERLA